MISQEEQTRYEALNQISRIGGIVLFGSTFANSIPVHELSDYFELDMPIYNRSVAHLTLERAKDYLKPCLFDLHPDKVFIQLGEDDLNASVSSSIDQYEWLLYQIHAELPDCRIYVLSVCSKKQNVKQFNQALQRLAIEVGCRFIDISDSEQHQRPTFRAFRILQPFFRDRSISFADAFSLRHV